MNLEQAVVTLYNASRRAPLDAAAHETCKQALEVLKAALNPPQPQEPPKVVNLEPGVS